MKKSRLVALVRSRLSDEVAPYLWPTAYIEECLNEAVQEANLRARLLIDSTTAEVVEIAVTAGQVVYPLHPKIIVARRIEWLRTGDGYKRMALRRRSFDELDRQWPHWRDSSAAEPRVVVQDLDEHSLTLHPAPSEDGTLRLVVWRHPLEAEEMTAGADEPVLKEQYHRRLTDWAIYQCLTNCEADLRNDAKAGEAYAAFEAEFGTRPTAAKLRELAVDHEQETVSYWY